MTDLDTPGEVEASGVVVGAVHPVPEPDEMAAIVAAIELAWPRPVVAPAPDEPSRWRFSGRWWTRPIPARRDRP